jgi:hypothetical protein
VPLKQIRVERAVRVEKIGYSVSATKMRGSSRGKDVERIDMHKVHGGDLPSQGAPQRERKLVFTREGSSLEVANLHPSIEDWFTDGNVQQPVPVNIRGVDGDFVSAAGQLPAQRRARCGRASVPGCKARDHVEYAHL